MRICMYTARTLMRIYRVLRRALGRKTMTVVTVIIAVFLIYELVKY